MDANTSITAALFSAFLECPTKAHLMAIGEPAPAAHFADIEARLSSLYKATAQKQLSAGSQMIELLNFGDLSRSFDDKTRTYLDCDTAIYDFALLPHRLGSEKRQKRSSAPFVPVRFLPWEKPALADSLLLCFGAFALAQATGIVVDTGTLLYGAGLRRKTVKIADHAAKTRQAIDAIGLTCHGREAPPLVLNKHCTVCDFQSRCRGLAVARDDLSLLSGMTSKERAKCNAKGIVSITQLSYGYRPRRRKRNRLNAQSAEKFGKRTASLVKNDYKLKALAVKKNQIHVVGGPSLQFDGTPVFFDVEGMPDRDFYYLAGLRFECGGGPVERSFWADGLDGERIMWENCLRELKAIGNAQIVSYGAYEMRFLKQMKARYVQAPDEVEFVDRLIATSVNLLGCIYGKIYFPTFSNGLKEVARYLGFEWNWPQASGAAAPLLRRIWELDADERLKQELISYNMDDCRAASKVADALVRICGGGSVGLDAVDVGSLEVAFQRTFGQFDSALPEFAKINKAAYWDYQRSKVYARTHKAIRRTVRKAQGGRKSTRVEKKVAIEDSPETCPKCQAAKFRTYRRQSQVVYDLKFMRRGIKRWTVRYSYNTYKCSQCLLEMTLYSRSSQYGPNLRIFIIYLLMELRLSNQKAAEHTASLFDLPVKKNTASQIKADMAEKYLPTYRSILRQIAQGKLVHADETKGVVYGGGHYIWVFANLTTVAYVYSESREATILEELLDGFGGVLISDFYAAYDSLPCVQQKCLIHLMRDINEDLHKNPFDDELKEIARRFSGLLQGIVETIDAHGLKMRYLNRHRRAADEFLEDIISMKCSTDAAVALRKRIEKNQDKLFTFLNYDGIPWNNNNAEHAVRAFTRLRNVINTSTPKGSREFATLLSIQQTLRYRGRSFLEFLRSGRTEIDG